MKEPRSIPRRPEWGGYVSVRSYLVGYAASIFLTLGASLLVWKQLLSGWPLGAALLGFALLQGWIQLYYYFNLGKEEKPRWNLIAFYFMFAILTIVVVGSLLIMYSLDYRMEG